MGKTYPQHILVWHCDTCGLEVNTAVVWDWDNGEPSREGQFPSCSWCYTELRFDGELYQPTISMEFTEVVTAAQAHREEEARRTRRQQARDKREAARRKEGVPEVVRVDEPQPCPVMMWDKLVKHLRDVIEAGWESRQQKRAEERLAAIGSFEKRLPFAAYTQPRPLRNFFKLAAQLLIPGQNEANYWARMDGEIAADDPLNLILDQPPSWVGRPFKITPYGYRLIPDSEANAAYHVPRKAMIAKEREARRSPKERAKRKAAERLRRAEAVELATQSRRNFRVLMRLLEQLRVRLSTPRVVKSALTPA